MSPSSLHIHAGILSAPTSQTVAPGETVYFNCHAIGTAVKWFINSSLVFVHTRGSFEAKGFNFIDDNIMNNQQSNNIQEWNKTIIVSAQPSINNTHIICRAEGTGHGSYVNESATLIVIGRFDSSKVNYTEE